MKIIDELREAAEKYSRETWPRYKAAMQGDASNFDYSAGCETGFYGGYESGRREEREIVSVALKQFFNGFPWPEIIDDAVNELGLDARPGETSGEK